MKQGNALPQLPLNFALEYVIIRKVTKANLDQVMNDPHSVLVYLDGVILKGDGIGSVEINADKLLNNFQGIAVAVYIGKTWKSEVLWIWQQMSFSL